MSKNQKLHIKSSWMAFLKLIRLPNLLIILLAQFLVRIFVIGPKEQWQKVLLDPSFILLCAATVLIAAAGYIINDYYDIKIDTINNPRRVVIGKVFTRRVAMLAHFSINLLAILISVFVGWKVFVTVIVSGFLMWYYSNTLKRLALWGNVTISLLSGISIYYLCFLSSNNHDLVLLYALFAFMISLIREIIKDMEDRIGDARYGCKTLPIVWGVRNTKYFVYALSLLFGAAMVLLFYKHYTYSLVLYFGLVLLPSFLFLLFKLYKAETEKHYHFLSTVCKIIMLLGLLSILLL